jgi:heat shock protein HslJ
LGGAQPPAAPGVAPDARAVQGQWDIVSFEGYRPKQRMSGTARAAYIDFGRRGVSLRIECNYSGRDGTVRDGRFIAVPRQETASTAMGCGPEREAREARLFDFFQRSPRIERSGPDSLRLTADGRELLLERPARRRLAFVPTQAELQGRWRLLGLTRYEPGGGYSGIGLSETPGRLVIEGDRLFHSRCPQQGLRFRYDEGGRLRNLDGLSSGREMGQCAALPGRSDTPSLPAPSDALRLLQAEPALERSGNDLLLSTERYGLLITRAPCRSQSQSADHKTVTVEDCASPE